jgi:hypothetical protein
MNHPLGIPIKSNCDSSPPGTMINAAGALLEMLSSGRGLHISGYSVPTPNCIKSNEGPMGHQRFLRHARYQAIGKMRALFDMNMSDLWALISHIRTVRHGVPPILCHDFYFNMG